MPTMTEFRRIEIMGPCEVCHVNKADQVHHLFSQTQINKKLYGQLIHHPKNLIKICGDCHLTKHIPKMTERQFCDALDIIPRSKTEKGRKYE